MLYEEFIALCQSKNWEKLEALLLQKIANDYKLIISTLINCYHPQKELMISQNEKLIQQEIEDKTINLQDFYLAFLIAKTGRNTKELGLNDDLVANALLNFAHKNKDELEWLLIDNHLSEKDKQNLSNFMRGYQFTQQLEKNSRSSITKNNLFAPPNSPADDRNNQPPQLGTDPTNFSSY